MSSISVSYAEPIAGIGDESSIVQGRSESRIAPVRVVTFVHAMSVLVRRPKVLFDTVITVELTTVSP